jgi:uncharacterized protein YjbI with pentapeptide repeats
MTYAISGGRRAVADDEHLALLRQGTAVWNEWRKRNRGIVPDLRGADLRDAKLRRANLRDAKLNGADLSGANLNEADLCEADLSRAILKAADLFRANMELAVLTAADLTDAFLEMAELHKANLTGADLAGAALNQANFEGADLTGARLTGANLLKTDFIEAVLNETDFSGAWLFQTIFAYSYLTKAIGLDKCEHGAPSIIDPYTLSTLNLPISFLRGCGIPEQLIEYLPSLTGAAIKFYSCFISYSAKDQLFAERLHADLQNKGVRCWFAPHDLPIGAKTWDTIDEAIRLRDKLLVILSKASIESDWVEDEVNKAYAEERSRKEVVLFPIRIDNMVTSTAEPWAVKLRDQRNIGDFRQWKEPAEYQKSLERLLRDLRASGNT